jgi:hypothetical protein
MANKILVLRNGAGVVVVDIGQSVAVPEETLCITTIGT